MSPVAIDPDKKTNKDAVKSTAFADDKGQERKKNKSTNTFVAKDRKKLLSQKDRSALQKRDILHMTRFSSDKMSAKERREIKKDTSFVRQNKELKKQQKELRFKKKENKKFEKTQKKVAQRHLKLQDPATRKRMKQHKRQAKKTVKRDMHPKNKNKIK